MADDLLNRNAIRLLREDWKTPGALAKELYTIIADEPSAGVSAQAPVARERAAAETSKTSLELPPPPVRQQQPLSPRTPSPIPSSAALAQLVIQQAQEQASRRQPGQALELPAPLEIASDQDGEAVPFQGSVFRSGPGGEPTSGTVGRRGDSDTGDDSAGPPFPHIEWPISPVGSANAGEPFGLPGAYHGRERNAGPPNSNNGPVQREVADDDPFARRYYDLRFPVTDFNSTDSIPGGSGTSSFVGQAIQQNGDAGGGGPAGSRGQLFNLYPDGVTAAVSDDSPATVVVLQLAEDLPVNTWVTGIQQTTDGTYYVSVPVWLA